MNGPASMVQRLFFALWPTPAVCGQLAELQKLLQRDARARWIPPEKLHVTLAFLGSVAIVRVPWLMNLTEAASPGCELRLDRLEFWRKRNLICLSPRQTPVPFMQWAEFFREKLRSAEFPVDTRPFRAHLTLGRNGRADWTARVLREPIHWPVRSFCLVESCLNREGANYRVMKTWPFEPGNPV